MISIVAFVQFIVLLNIVPYVGNIATDIVIYAAQKFNRWPVWFNNKLKNRSNLMYNAIIIDKS